MPLAFFNINSFPVRALPRSSAAHSLPISVLCASTVNSFQTNPEIRFANSAPTAPSNFPAFHPTPNPASPTFGIM